MQLAQPVRAIIAEIERLSGKPVELLADPSLAVLTSVITARDAAPFHVIRYRPDAAPLDYRIALQAGYTVRLFQCPPGQRWAFQPVPAALPAMAVAIRRACELTAEDETRLPAFARAAVQWALTVLRSVPVGMRIDVWLYETCAELRAQQRLAITALQARNLASVRRKLGHLRVPNRYIAMHAAEALLADRLCESATFAAPYRDLGALEAGRRLLGLFDAMPPTPLDDCALVDAWADVLGMRDWYRWA